MDLSALRAIDAERAARRAVILLTDLDSGVGRVIFEAEQLDGDLAEPIAKAFRTGTSTSLEIDGKAHFVNVYLPEPRLVIIGAVHISQALGPMAKTAGFAVQIIDPRTAFATGERFPAVDLKAEWPEDVLAREPLDSYTAVAALTHDPKIDDYPLKAALDAGCFYVGALGSRKTHAKRLERLLRMGASETEVARINAPIGLNIGASNPAEIAVAVLAQVIGSLRSRASAARSAAA